MNPYITKLVNDFLKSPATEPILSILADDIIIPELSKLSDLDRYAVYIRVVSCSIHNINQAKVLLERMLKFNLLSAEFLEQEKTTYCKNLPGWVNELIAKYN